MKPKMHTKYIRFPKKLRRMRKYVSKSKRTDDTLWNYSSTYLFEYWSIRLYKQLSVALKKVIKEIGEENVKKYILGIKEK